MDPVRNPAFLLANACYGAESLTDLVSVMEELKMVIETENEHMTRGLPPSILDTGLEKSLLSEEFRQLYAEIAGEEGIDIDDPALQEQVMKANAELQELSEENTDLLNKALSATRRRVDAVMEAIRATGDLPPDHDFAEDAAAKRGN